MTRWEPNARGRLEDAAMELYRERGFDQTTVAQIAERAGLTERTFFRHFADKREVLFAGSGELRDFLVRSVADAPGHAAPLEAAAAGLDTMGRFLQERRGSRFARARQSIIAGSTELQEREGNKLASLAAALGDALRERGVADPAASLAGEVTIAVFRISFERWVAEGNTRDLTELMQESLDELRALARDAGRVPAAS
jgi:AcrR family transcriptional regulator